MTKKDLQTAAGKVEDCDLYIPKESSSTSSTNGRKKNQKEASKPDQEVTKKRAHYDARVLNHGPPAIFAEAFTKCRQGKKNSRTCKLKQ